MRYIYITCTPFRLNVNYLLYPNTSSFVLFTYHLYLINIPHLHKYINYNLYLIPFILYALAYKL